MDTFHETDAHFMKLIISLGKRNLYKAPTVDKTNTIAKCLFLVIFRVVVLSFISMINATERNTKRKCDRTNILLMFSFSVLSELNCHTCAWTMIKTIKYIIPSAIGKVHVDYFNDKMYCSHVIVKTIIRLQSPVFQILIKLQFFFFFFKPRL